MKKTATPQKKHHQQQQNWIFISPKQWFLVQSQVSVLSFSIVFVEGDHGFYLISWWFQPIWKNMLVKMGSSSPIFGVKIQKIFEVATI